MSLLLLIAFSAIETDSYLLCVVAAVAVTLVLALALVLTTVVAVTGVAENSPKQH